jgi:hypothetical protein
MFIHFGLYAIPARGEWVRSMEQISLEDYQQFFDEFNPVDFDAKVWAKLAKEAGMKYAVLTSKHHDGFCLYDSKLTDYKITNTPFGRDLVKEFVEAFRAEGIRWGCITRCSIGIIPVIPLTATVPTRCATMKRLREWSTTGPATLNTSMDRCGKYVQTMGN